MANEDRDPRARQAAVDEDPEEAEELALIWVMAHPRIGERVALSEVNPAHPGGEAWVDGLNREPVEVAMTPAVAERLSPRDGSLVQLQGRTLERARDTWKAEQDRRRMAREQALATAVTAPAAPAAPATRESDKELADRQAKLDALDKQIAEREKQLAASLEAEVARAQAEQAQRQADAAAASAAATVGEPVIEPKATGQTQTRKP